MFREILTAAITITCGEIGNCPNKTPTLDLALTNIVAILFSLVGGLSLVFLLWGGLRYVISRGDPSQIKAAKETITYAIVGIVVAIAAGSIVAFIATKLG
jgi:Type IV secretion system pilin